MTCKTASWISGFVSMLLAGVALWWSPLNQDEGWYLMAVQRVSEGFVPYLDFAFTQPPVFPTVYQLANPLIHFFGMLGGRIFTLGCAGLSFLILLYTLRRSISPATFPLSVLLLVCLLGLNPAYLQFSATVKPYSLATLFIAGAMAFRYRSESHRQATSLFLCGVCCALAMGTRLSLGAFAVALFAELLWHRRELGNSAALWFALGGMLTLCGLFGPFLLLAPEQFEFGLLEFHMGRVTEHSLLTRGAFMIRWARTIFPVALIVLWLGTRWKDLRPVSKAFLGGAVLISLVHLLAPFPYDEYQTVLLPVLVFVIAVEAPQRIPETLSGRAPAWILMVTLLFAVSSPSIESWFSGARDRLWWPAKLESDLYGLKGAAEIIQEHDPDGTLLFTTDTYVAIQSGRDVPRGLEMGPFSYFPEMETHRAERLHVVNPERLETMILESKAKVVALSGYGFTIQSPMLTPTPREDLDMIYGWIQKRYGFTEAWPVGQNHTLLRVFTLKEGLPED